MLEKLKKEILEDGKIDKEEVDKLESVLYEDGIIDREEADFLFELNDNSKDNCAEWKEFFVKAITDHVLADEVSPGVVDDDEADWLKAKVEGDGKIDDVEKALLLNIKDKATSLSPKAEFLIKMAE